jgi:hypothetical protein
LPNSPTGNPPPNTERVLMADATLCMPDSITTATKYTATGVTYKEVEGGFYKRHISAHLAKDFPDGGNVAFKDGHAKWRKFDLMEKRTRLGRPFWW